jgi:erythromycin esterase-like protein
MVPESCEREVVDLLVQLRKNMSSYNSDVEAVMNAEQNAHVIVNAERYYRAMVHTGPESWNIRDHHMTDTLTRLMKFYGPEAKAIVWEHNTHIGDARFTDMSREGMVNVGQLINQQHGDSGVYSVGFGSYKGEVIAGQEWGDVMRVMKVPEAVTDSWEFILHQLNGKDRLVFMNSQMQKALGKKEFGHRAIGVVYRPHFEQLGNYVPSIMPYRYDAFIFLDKSTALHPLHLNKDSHKTPDTFPFGV